VTFGGNESSGLETLHWLRQYGEPPGGITLQEIYQRLINEDDKQEEKNT